MLAGTLDRWQQQQCQLISTACKLRGGAGVIGVQRAQTSAATCWLLREQGKAKREHGREAGHVRAGAVAFFSSRPSSRRRQPEGSSISIARGGTMRRGEEVGGEVVRARDWRVLHVACWAQGFACESPLAVVIMAIMAVAVAERGDWARCEEPNAAFLQARGTR